MKVIAMNSSARKDGNTAIAINTIFEELNKEGIETEMIQLANTIINPCIACWACSHRGNCINKKDRSTYWNMVYGQMPGDVQNDEEGLTNMKNIGQNMAYLLNILGGYKNEKI